MSEILDFIANNGFAIVACVALYVQMVKSDERHKEEVETLATALNDNTFILESIKEAIKEVLRKND